LAVEVMSMIGLIDCRECDSPDCRGCNLYRLAEALQQGKLDWMKDEKNGIRVPDMSEALAYDRDQYKKGYADGAKETLDALDLVTWYNDLAETVSKWGNLEPEGSIIAVPDDYGINPHWCTAEDRPQLQVLWMIAVSLFGNYGTSPRYGWIEDIDGFRQWVRDITKTWREGTE
jgi:hypothetical protein